MEFCHNPPRRSSRQSENHQSRRRARAEDVRVMRRHFNKLKK
jgi:hypothetical protein